MSINDGLALIRRHDFEGALPLLAAEVRKRPDDAYAAYYLAYAFVGAQDPQPAVTLLTKIIEVHPDFTDAHTLLGLARIRTSDFVGAAEEYEAVLAREPKNPAALLGLGMIAFWQRETAAAEDYLGCAAEMEQAVEAVSNSSKAWAYEAYCLLLDHDNNAGLSAWYTARTFEPNVTLDAQSDQQLLLAKVRIASQPAKTGPK